MYLLCRGPNGGLKAHTDLSSCKPLSLSLTFPIHHREMGFLEIRFLPCVFPGIFYLAKTVTLPQ